MKNKETEIRFLHNSLLIDNKILVISDVHIGFEEHIFTQGLFPRTQIKETMGKIDGIFSLLKKQGIKIEKIIILGDLKHEFGGISETEWRETMQFLDYLEKKLQINSKKPGKKEIILIKGNHDTILGPIAKKKELKVVDYYKYKEVCFVHGDKERACIKDKKTRILIMGHLHPSVTLYDKYKREKYKCFLKGRWKNKQVYVLPSFGTISFGYDLMRAEFDHEFHNGNGFFIVNSRQLRDFDILIYNNKEDKIYNFGSLKKLMRKK